MLQAYQHPAILYQQKNSPDLNDFQNFHIIGFGVFKY